ncbi:hypothetical protein ACFLZZ_03550 [Nanoarchaeota archaeon]
MLKRGLIVFLVLGILFSFSFVSGEIPPVDETYQKVIGDGDASSIPGYDLLPDSVRTHDLPEGLSGAQTAAEAGEGVTVDCAGIPCEDYVKNIITQARDLAIEEEKKSAASEEEEKEEETVAAEETTEEKSEEEKIQENIERRFRPLFGRGGGEGISPSGYPQASFLQRYTEQTGASLAIGMGDDGKNYLISSEGTQAIFEGIGVHQGGKIEIQINSNSFGTEKEFEAGKGGKPKYDAKVGDEEGLLKNINVKEAVDPETNETILVLEAEVDKDALVGEQDVEITLTADGEEVGAINFKAEVQEKKTNWLGVIGTLVGLSLLVIGLLYGLRYWKNKKSSEGQPPETQPAQQPPTQPPVEVQQSQPVQQPIQQ